MKKFYSIFSLGCLLLANAGYTMNNPKFSNGSIVRVVRGPEKIRGQLMEIQGTTKDVWEIDDVYGSPEALRIRAIIKYLDRPEAKDDYGIVYYARYIMDSSKDCVHESWLELDTTFDKEDMPVSWRSDASGKIVHIETVRDLKKREAERRLKVYTFDEFKKEYVDHYYPSVLSDQASFVAHAPHELKQWFAEIKDGKKPDSLLVYGATGVGKSMTAQALVKESGARLYYIPQPAVMRHDWYSNRFEQKYLNDVSETTCLIVDFIEHLDADDVENLQSLARICASKNNLHLLAITYHAKKNMPPALYKKFRSLKFPMPDEQKKLKLMQHFLTDSPLERDVDESYLKNLVSRIPNCTARTLEHVHQCAIKSYYSEARAKDSEKTETLSKTNFEDGLKRLMKSKKELGIEGLDEYE